MNKDWVELPSGGFAGEVPSFPLHDALEVETELWAELWTKPQAAAWSSLGLKFQVAAYVRAFVESVEAGASAGLKTAVLRMEAELGLSIPGLRSNGWRISDGTAAAPATTAPAARKTSSGDWLKAVSVEGA
jgi:hypothetical protein